MHCMHQPNKRYGSLPAHYYVQLMIPTESAHDTVAVLGEVGVLQFKDLNAGTSAAQRAFANQVGMGGAGGFFA